LQVGAGGVRSDGACTPQFQRDASDSPAAAAISGCLGGGGDRR